MALAFATWPLSSASTTDGYAYSHGEGTKDGEIMRSVTSSKRKSSSHVRGSNKEMVHRARRAQVADYCPMPKVRELGANTYEDDAFLT